MLIKEKAPIISNSFNIVPEDNIFHDIIKSLDYKIIKNFINYARS